MSRLADQSGSFMLQTLILLMLIMLMCGSTLQWVLARGVAVRKAVEKERDSQVAQDVESQAQACLMGSSIGQSCAPSLLSGCNFPAQLEGRAITVSLRGSPPFCELEILLVSP